MALVEVEPTPEMGGSTFEVAVSGDLDLARSRELGGLLDAFAASGCANVVLDVDQVTFCDSTGLSAIVALVRAADARGGRLSLHGADARMRRMLAITGIGQLLDVVDAEP
jgi:anti-sigma B factor antagonist